MCRDVPPCCLPGPPSQMTFASVLFPGGFRGFVLEDEHGKPIPAYRSLWDDGQRMDLRV